MEQDNRITEAFNKVKKDIKDLSEMIISKKEIELMIREAMLMVQSEPNSEPNQNHFNKMILQEAKKTRPEAIKHIIRMYLHEGKRTKDIFKLIVEEKQLISKTQFYHYLTLVRTELRTEPLFRVENEENIEKKGYKES